MVGILALLAAAPAAAQGGPTWNGPRPYNFFEAACRFETWCLGAVSVVHQRTANERGGPQALEGYTVIETRGRVRLAMGTIGNVEQAGSGEIVEVRPLQSGGVLTGTGRVHRWTSLFLDRPKDKTPNQIVDYRAIQFDNGLHLTTGVDPRDGKPYLALCPDDPRAGPCQLFKP